MERLWVRNKIYQPRDTACQHRQWGHIFHILQQYFHRTLKHTVCRGVSVERLWVRNEIQQPGNATGQHRQRYSIHIDMSYTISESHHKAIIADNIVLRDREVFAYDMNITNYEALLAGLPQDDWPEHLVQYKGLTADRIPDEFDDICNNLNYRDHIRGLLKTERAERAKSQQVLDVLVAQIPENELEAALQAALQRLDNA